MATRVYHTVVIRVSRRTNDVDGNPRFRLHTEAGEVLMVEGQAAYSVDESWSEQGVRLVLDTADNRVVGIEVDGAY
jgi:hypothetical protein